ncbi:MAG: hypothetical protein M3Y65_18250 [Pseudomonadota bacterium]|nr:hypothetical protein [Pseudomonadota bacterium]
MTAAAPQLQPWTGADIDVGSRLVAMLMQHAGAHPGVQLGGAALLALARKAHPRDALLGRAVPLGLAPKLAFVTAFCTQYGYPDLATLVLPQPLDAAVTGHDWSSVGAAQLTAFVKASHAGVPARFKTRAERPADVAWYAYFRSHRPACEAVSGEGKKEIINLMMAGLDPETALARVLAAQAALS